MTDDEKAEAVVLGVSNMYQLNFVCPECGDTLLAEPGKVSFCSTCKQDFCSLSGPTDLTSPMWAHNWVDAAKPKWPL